MSTPPGFTPHSLYKGFAIRRTPTSTRKTGIRNEWYAVSFDEETGQFTDFENVVLVRLKRQIDEYLNSKTN